MYFIIIYQCLMFLSDQFFILPLHFEFKRNYGIRYEWS